MLDCTGIKIKENNLVFEDGINDLDNLAESDLWELLQSAELSDTFNLDMEECYVE